MTEWLDVGVRNQGNGGKTIVRDLNAISESSKKADKDLSALGKNAAVVGGIIGTAIGAIVGTGLTLIASGFKNASQNIKETVGYARQLGETVTTFSQLDFAARSYDMTTKDLASSMEQLQTAQIEAAKPGKEMNKIFDQLDISATNADGSLRKTSEVMRDVADIFQRMPDGTNKAALSMKLFGNANRETIALLSQGSQGLDEMAQKADELGYTVGDKTAGDVKKFYDQLDDVKLQIEALYRQALPTLLPYLDQFGNLLSSQEFKDGFNTIIQGAANAVVWLAKLSTQFVNTIRTLSENVAANQFGAALDDAPRVNKELDRIEDRIKYLQEWQQKGRLGRALSGTGQADPYARNQDRTIGMPFGDMQESAAKELNILTERRNTLLQAQRDISAANWQAEQDDIKKTLEALAKYDAQQAKGPAADGATVDWTKLGRDPPGGGGKGKVDRTAERERRQLLNDYESIIQMADPVAAAQMRVSDAEDVLAKAVKNGWVEQEKANQLKEQYKFLLEDQIDPLGAMNRELEKEVKLAGLSNDEREIQAQVLDRVNQLKLQGKVLDEAEIQNLTSLLEKLRATNDEMARRENIRANSSVGQLEEFGKNLGAFGKEQEGMSEGDKFNWLNQQLGGSLEDTQSALDARLEQLDVYYQMVQQFRDADVSNAKLAAEAMNAIEDARMQIRIEQVQNGLGQIAQLMGSHNKTAFRIGQAAAIAQVAIATPQAAMDAYKSLQGIPYIGPVLGAAAAAAAVAYGAMQISKIRSQQPPQFRTGGEMIVGGHGGVDSQMVSMRATPGEKISINTPRQASAMERMAAVMEHNAGGRGNTEFNLTVVQQGRPDNYTPEQNARAMRKQAEKMGVV